MNSELKYNSIDDYTEVLKKKIIDILLKKRIVDVKDANNLIISVKSLLESHRNEINWLFNLLEKTESNLHKIYIKKPICIELYEYANILNIVYTKINNEIIPNINNILSKTTTQITIDSIDRNIKNELKKIRKYLTEPRNKMVAHRYTNRDGQYITIGELIKYIEKLSENKLKDIRDKLFSIHKLIEIFIKNNKNIILDSN